MFTLFLHQQTSSKDEENSFGHQSLLERERREWNIRQASLQQQVADAQAECRWVGVCTWCCSDHHYRRIKTACSEVEQRTRRREDSMIDRVSIGLLTFSTDLLLCLAIFLSESSWFLFVSPSSFLSTCHHITSTWFCPSSFSPSHKAACSHSLSLW